MANDEAKALALKKAAFAQLDALQAEEAEEPDEGYQTSMRALSDYVIKYNEDCSDALSSQSCVVTKDYAPQGLSRSVSLMDHRINTPSTTKPRPLRRSETSPRERPAFERESDEVTVIKATPRLSISRSEGLLRTANAMTGRTQGAGKATGRVSGTNTTIGKRKRSNGNPRVPEAQRIFRDTTMSSASSRSVSRSPIDFSQCSSLTTT